MTNEEKAAVLLLSLGKEVAANVMKNFGDNEIKRVGKCMTALKRVSNEDVEKIAGEFCDLARKGGMGIPSVKTHIVEDMLLKAMGEEKGKAVIQSIEDEKFASDNSAINRLRQTAPKIVADATHLEHPQTTALILAHLRPEQSAEILENFPAEKQNDIAGRIATLGNVPHEFVEEVAGSLEASLILGDENREEVGGVHMMAEILNQMSKASEKAVLEAFEQNDPNTAAEIKDLMFTFDDIFKIDDKGLQTLLEAVTREDLARALKIVDDEMQEKIFKNISKRAAEMLKEDIANMPPTKLSDVEKSQRVLIDTAKQLEAEGKIAIAGGAEEDALV
ncbi:MAG: flagellar motor switch protein FliG [Deltaproteobacteria bacterium]|nr:flagellar motor switch protein FliG [Deltaproteobacteria bacterium]